MKTSESQDKVLAIFVRCTICNENLDGDKLTVQLGQRGSDGVNKASKLRKDSVVTIPGQKVHKECRKLYCNPSEIRKVLNQKQETTEAESPSLRSSTGSFSFGTHCLFCARPAKTFNKKRARDVYPVRTLSFKDNIREICKTRQDEWAREVDCRLQNINDLPAADAVYHQLCSVNFRTGKHMPNRFEGCEEKKRKCGRPVNIVQENSFNEIIAYLEENFDDKVTILELVDRMTEQCGEMAYSPTHMRSRLLQHFGSSIHITDMNGKPNVVTFKRTVSSILHSFHSKTNNTDPNREKIEIVQTAAKLILSDIADIQISKSTYPDSNSMMSSEENLQFVPTSLKCFLQELCREKNSEIKIASIGQALIQAARPKSLICPLQIGLGVQMHHHFASKFLIDMLNKLGFSASYREVQTFEGSAAMSQGINLPLLENGQFCQFVGDNVDHNLRTLDGHNTFHGMGLIACFTPKLNKQTLIQRIIVSPDELSKLAKIDIKFYKQESSHMRDLVFEKLPDLEAEDYTENIDLLSKCIWPSKRQKPGWSGYMQAIHKGKHLGRSSVCLLPMIDMEASDISCIYSVLQFLIRQGQLHDITPVITFDQPLYWKAMTIVCNEPTTSKLKSIVIRLGGFHSIMSFLGCIGRLMEGSGLSELFETVYAQNAVVHMMSGKAVSRAIRAHIITEEVLYTFLVHKAFGLDLPKATADEHEVGLSENVASGEIQKNGSIDNQTDGKTIIANVTAIYNDLFQGERSVENACKDSEVKNLKLKIVGVQEHLSQFRTSKLWLMYLSMISILCRFIKAERTGNWLLHLQALKDMLPYLAAAGHNLYVKSAYLYLQTMSKLEINHPDIYQQFANGNHVVRRSDRFWAGLSTDLVIEQVLMRSMKTTGGLTRGRGLSESQRNQWLLSMPACSEYNSAMQEFAGVAYYTSDQHIECSDARLERDEKDKNIFLQFLHDRDPFDEQHSLRNIDSGITADELVNVENAAEVGNIIINRMQAENILKFSFKRSCQAVTLISKSAVTINSESIVVDPQLLFQRLAAAADRLYDNQSEVFKYELCSYPSSLFETYGVMRQPDKPALANAIWSLGNCGIEDEIDDSVKFVVDGGSLLQRIPWTRGCTFGEICHSYLAYIEQNCPSSTIVFDGYRSEMSTKSCAHQRRSKGRSCTKVQFTEKTPLRTRKDNFLSNAENKQSFIDLLSNYFRTHGYTTVHATEDADLLIVLTAVESAKTCTTAVVGEDTDLLVLLCYHADISANNLFLIPGRNLKISKSQKEWNIISTKKILGTTMCSSLPFIHAITGCDTTSRIYGIGKSAALRKFKSCPDMRELTTVFLDVKSDKTDILRAGEEILVSLYKGDKHESLDSVRYRKFVNKVMTNLNYVQVYTLPPTSASAHYHILRTYFQVQRWLNIELNLDPLQWGWKVESGSYMPVQTHLTAAPEDLLKVVRCSCKVNCDTKRCTCRRYGLDCSSACGECRGISCSNNDVVFEAESEEVLN